VHMAVGQLAAPMTEWVGFRAPTRKKSAGKLRDPVAREIVTTLSSKGWQK